MRPIKHTEICKEQKINIMEALLIINSILVAICLYFIKDFHGDFKKVVKKVGKLTEKVNMISMELNGYEKPTKKKS